MIKAMIKTTNLNLPNFSQDLYEFLPPPRSCSFSPLESVNICKETIDILQTLKSWEGTWYYWGN